MMKKTCYGLGTGGFATIPVIIAVMVGGALAAAGAYYLLHANPEALGPERSRVQQGDADSPSVQIKPVSEQSYAIPSGFKRIDDQVLKVSMVVPDSWTFTRGENDNDKGNFGNMNDFIVQSPDVVYQASPTHWGWDVIAGARIYAYSPSHVDDEYWDSRKDNVFSVGTSSDDDGSNMDGYFLRIGRTVGSIHAVIQFDYNCKPCTLQDWENVQEFVEGFRFLPAPDPLVSMDPALTTHHELLSSMSVDPTEAGVVIRWKPSQDTLDQFLNYSDRFKIEYHLISDAGVDIGRLVDAPGRTLVNNIYDEGSIVWDSSYRLTGYDKHGKSYIKPDLTKKYKIRAALENTQGVSYRCDPRYAYVCVPLYDWPHEKILEAKMYYTDSAPITLE